MISCFGVVLMTFILLLFNNESVIYGMGVSQFVIFIVYANYKVSSVRFPIVFYSNIVFLCLECTELHPVGRCEGESIRSTYLPHIPR